MTKKVFESRKSEPSEIIRWFQDAVEHYEKKKAAYQSIGDKGIWNYE